MTKEEGQPLVAESFKYEWITGNEIVYDDEYNDTDEEVIELLQRNRRDAPLIVTQTTVTTMMIKRMEI